MTVIAPVTYAALYDLSFRTDANPLNGPDGFMTLALVALKLLTIAALVTGVHQIGTRITVRPSLAWPAATVWAFVGVALAASNKGTAWFWDAPQWAWVPVAAIDEYLTP